jgi:hypothetical protein
VPTNCIRNPLSELKSSLNIKRSYVLTFWKSNKTTSRSKAGTVYDSLNIQIAGSNPARSMDVCLRVSVLCCPVFR